VKIEGTGLPPVLRPGEGYQPEGGRAASGKEAPPPSTGADEVALSAVSQALAQLPAVNDVREDLVEEITAQIEKGEYLDTAKLTTAALRLLGYL
jgi:anti-sigma28 factor (negative regulator of flagellin synthesis)